MVCFRDLPVAKKFMSKTGLGVSSFSVEIFLSHSSESFRRGILQRFINFGYRKSLGIRGGAGGFTFFRRSCFVAVYRSVS